MIEEYLPLFALSLWAVIHFVMAKLIHKWLNSAEEVLPAFPLPIGVHLALVPFSILFTVLLSWAIILLL